MNNLVWRNTKESIQDEYDVPDYEEEIIWIDCQPIEDLYYSQRKVFLIILITGNVAIFIKY